MATEFTLPELGENIAGGDVAARAGQPGDTIAKDQPVLELETDKATIEVPSTVAGTVTEVHVKAGEKVKVGQVDPDASTRRAAGAPPAAQPTPAPRRGGDAAGADAGAAVAAATRPARRRAGDAASRPAAGEPSTRAQAPAAAPRVDAAAGAVPVPPAAPRRAVRAPVRARTRRRHRPGARHRPGRPHLDRRREGATRSAVTPAAAPAPARRRRRRRCPTSRSGATVEREPMRTVRRKTAEHLSAAHGRTIPHVTQHDKADITALEELRKQLRAAGRGGRRQAHRDGDRAQGRRRRAEACSRSSTPASTWRTSEIVYKKYVHIGVAVDTERGLLVPVIRDVDKKNIVADRGRAGAARREGARRQARARGDAGRLLHDHQPRRHRRHALHADRQLRPRWRSSASSRARDWSRSATGRRSSSRG